MKTFKEIDIKYYDNSGNVQVRCTVPVTQEASVHYELMQSHYCKLSFNLSRPTYFLRGDFIETPYGRFELIDLTKAKDNDTIGYSYEIQFDAYYRKLKNKILKYRPNTGSQEATFSLTSKISTHIEVIMKNLAYYAKLDKSYLYDPNFEGEGTDYTYVIDASVDANAAKLITYSNTSILDAIANIAQTFGCEWWFEGNILHFGTCENTNAITDFRLNDNIVSMSSSQSQSTYANRVYAFGAARNLPSGYKNDSDADITKDGVVEKRLMLPTSAECSEQNKQMLAENGFELNNGYIQVGGLHEDQYVEGVTTNDDIYPRNLIKTSKVTSYEKDVEDESTPEEGDYIKRTFYRVNSLAIVNEDGEKTGDMAFRKAYILSGKNLHIVFQSGSLSGMNFECEFNPDGVSEILKDDDGNPILKDGKEQINPKSQVFEIVANEDYGRFLPDITLHPKDGDTFVLYNWDSTKLGDTLVSSASNELLTDAIKDLKKSMIDPTTYTCTAEANYSYNQGRGNLHGVGDRVNLYNKGYGDSYRASRIIGYEFCLDIPYDGAKYYVGEKPSYSRLNAMESKIEELVYNGQSYLNGNGGSGRSIYIIKSYDSITPTDYNVFSAKAVDEQRLNKTKDDTAKGTITWEKVQKLLSGLLVGNFNNENGGSWTPDTEGRSHLITDYLEVRMKAIFEELVIKKTSTIGGKEIISPAGGVVAHKVEEVTVTYNNVSQKAYRCYFLAEQEGDAVDNDFSVNDQVRSESFNVRKGTYHKVGNHFYWRLVIGRDEEPVELEGKKYHYIDLSDTDCATASDVPAKGDVLSQCGNRTDVERQNCLIFSAVDTYSPSVSLYHGINSYSFANKEYVEYGVNKQTNKAFFNVYGDMYVGDRPTKENGYEGSSYIKYDSAAKQVSIKGKLSAKSTVDGKELSQYIKENSAGGLTEEQVNNLIKNSQVIADLQNQVDGAIETWFYDGVPTLKNAPASSWTTDKEKDTHLGDLYYDNKTGKAYRFAKDGNTYKWTIIADTDIAKALSDASKAQETADGKMKVFSTQPIPPYQLGDIWVNATYPTDGSIYKNEILRCQTAKAKGSSFAIADWTKASKYTDDSALNTFKEEYKNDMASYKEQLDEKVETWFYNYAPTTQNKPASDWTTDTLKSQHAGDLFYNTSNGYTYRWTGTAWARIKDNDINTAMTAASKAQDTADGKRTVFTSQPTVPYDEGDLWASGGDDGKTLMVCIKSRTTGSFTSSEWVKANDSDLNAFAKTIEESLTGIQDQLDKKAETWYQSTDPSTSWTTDDAKKKHKGDLWYNTSNNQTFFWNGTKWDKQDVPTEVFDKIDGKSSIYVSKPASYEERDLWILEAAYTLGGVAYSKGELVVATKSNASFSAADWTKKVKYTDDTVANAAKKAAEEAKKAADTAQTNVTNLGKTVTSNKKAFDSYVTDGYLEPSEIAAMAQDSKRLEDAFAAAEKSYNEVKGAEVLKSTKELTDLNTAFTTLSTAKKELITYLSDISTRYNAADTEGKANIVSAVGTKFTNFQSAYSAFYDKLGLANAYITSKIYGDLKQNITDLAGYKYLKDALGQTTDIDGGLVMTTLLALRDGDGNVQSGINGAIDPNRGKKSIATWWGGQMVDKDYNSGNLTPATSLIRFDGSGYLANGAIWWDVSGKVHADPTSFIISEKNLGAYLTFFEPTWKAGSAGTSVADLVSLKPNAPFTKLGVSGDATFEGAITFHGIKLTYDAANKAIKIDGNLYATGGITAYGASSVSGGGGLNASVISYARIIEGSYTDADLTSIPNAYAIKALSSRIDNIATELGGLSLSWNNITGKPSTFAPSAHTHKWAEITDRITKVSQLTNDAGYLTAHQSLASYYTKAEIDAKGYTTNKGTVTSVGLTLPTGLTCATKTITTSGTFAISLASGYSIPTTAKQTAWDGAVSAKHTHSNKSVLDGISSTKVSHWDSAYGWYALMTTDEETADGVINKWNEVVSFLANIAQTDTLSGIVDGINKSISDEVTRAKKAEGVNASGISTNKTSITTLQGYFTNGSAKKALQLTNARKLWGNSFNGLGDINGSIIVPDGKYISIGNIKMEYDATNKALKITNTTTNEVANLYTSGGVTAYGVGTSSSSEGGLNGSVKSYSNALKLTSESLSEIASAYSIKALDSRISSLEGGSAMDVSVSGSGNAVTAISKSGTTIIVTKGTTFLTSHQSLASYLTKTDAASLYQPKGNYLTAHQSLDGYVNAIAVSGSGNAVTAVTKSGKTITFTKGATYLTSHQSLSNYYTKSSVDSLLNGKSATTHTHSVKINGITKTIAASGGDAVDLGTYLTAHQSLAAYATQNWVKNEATAHNAEMVDNYHASGLFTGFSISDVANKVTISIGGTSKALNLVRAFPSGVGNNFNDIATHGNSMGMSNIAAPYASSTANYQTLNGYVNPNGQTGWHHYINLSYTDSNNTATSPNMWQTQFAIKAGTTEVYVRSRDGGKISNDAAWAAPWVRLARVTDNVASASKVANALSWSGYSSGSYNGSAAKSISIPNNTNQLTNGAGFITASASISGNAGSATKLQNARTINGTSFNGTANIVTSYWGTTRKLWGNSVNGNADVNGSITIANTDGVYVQIGDVRLVYDKANTAIKVVKSDGTTAANFYATGGITAYGEGSGSSGGGGLNGSVKSYADSLKLASESLSEIASAYSIKALDSRISSLEGGSAMDVSVSGSGNAVTAISKSGTTIIVTKGTTFLTSHQSLASYLTKTDAASLYQPKGNYLTAHQSLDGYVNAIAVSGSGNAVTAVTKSGKTITFTKGATYLTSHQSLSNYYTKSSVDSLLNGKSATTHTHSVKINGITKTIAASGGDAVDLGTYLTAHQSLAAYATQNWVKNEATAHNAEMVDNYHASGLFTGFSISDVANKVTISIGGTSKALNLVRAFPSGVGNNFNDIATHGNSMGMSNIAAPYASSTANYQTLNGYVNPNGQTGWHHYINLSYTDSNNTATSPNMWQTQFAIKAGTTEVYVRSRDGGKISNDAAWAAPWVRLARVTDNVASASKVANALSWSGYSSGSYNGSAAKSISIPNNTNQLTNGAGFITASASISGNAGSATKLQNARTINGTSFNGTANIVTSYWGTTRKLWGNSVNGNADVNGSITIANTDGVYVQIGDVRLVYDKANTAIKVVKSDGTTAANFYATGGITAYGEGSGSSGGGGLNGSVKSYADSLKLASESLSEIASAYSIKQLSTRITSLEGGSATSISVSGDGNAVTSVTKNGTTISVVKGSTFLTSHQSLSAYLKTENANNTFLKLSGGTISNDLIVNGSIKTTKLYLPSMGEGYIVSGVKDTNGSDFASVNCILKNWNSLGISSYDDIIRIVFNSRAGDIYLRGKLSAASLSGNLSWSYITDRPSSYTPSAHTHKWTEITDRPSSLKNPSALSWSGYSSGSYDGSAAKSISIPNNTNQLTNGAGFITASASITGNAATATKVNHSLSVFGKSFNGSADVTVADTDLIASISTATANLTDKTEILTSYASDNGFNDSNAKNRIYRRPASAIWGYINSKTISNADKLDGVHASGLFTNLSNSGNNISITIGGTNKTLTAAYATNCDTVDGYHAQAGSSKPYGKIPVIGTDGVIELGHYIDFHHDNTTGSDYSVRLQTNGNHSNVVTLPTATGTLALTSDNVASATKLQTTRTLWGQSFNGTANISGSMTGVGDMTLDAGARIKHGSGNLYIGNSDNSNWIGVQDICSQSSIGDGNWSLRTSGAAHFKDTTINGTATIKDLLSLVDGSHKGLKMGSTYISSLDGEVILQGNTALRFGNDAWDYNQWAGLKYDHSIKTVYLGIADGSIFKANSAQSGGVINLKQGISSVYTPTLYAGGDIYHTGTYRMLWKNSKASKYLNVMNISQDDNGILTIGYGNFSNNKNVVLEGYNLNFRVGNDSGMKSMWLDYNNGNPVLSLDGNFYATGGVTAYKSSDERLKHDIHGVDSLAIIKAMGGTVAFRYNADNKDSIGWIAQRVLHNTFMQDLVEKDDKGFLKINYWSPKLIAVAFGAIEQVDDEVSRLKRRVRDLENEVEQLKSDRL